MFSKRHERKRGTTKKMKGASRKGKGDKKG
jgi:hypothetical protein